MVQISLQQDGGIAHTAKLVQDFLATNCSEFTDKDKWPPNSPDPLDYHVWCNGSAAEPGVVDYRDAALSLLPFIILHRRLRAFCCCPFVSLSFFARPIRRALLSSVSASVAQSIRLHARAH